jgi:CheY-like chemotaxis protein
LSRLLLVDDDEDNLVLFKDILNDFGFMVDAFHDPVEALLKFKPNYYDLLILDYLMPQLNGLELFKKIREIDESPKLMLITASHKQPETNDTEEQLQIKVVRKPVTITKFLREIRTILATDEKSHYMVNTTS